MHLNDLIVLVFEYLLYNSLLGFWDPFHSVNPYVFGDLKWVVGLVRALKPTLNLLLKKDPSKDNWLSVQEVCKVEGCGLHLKQGLRASGNAWKPRSLLHIKTSHICFFKIATKGGWHAFFRLLACVPCTNPSSFHITSFNS
jgi:hypothetical protein